MSTHPQLRKHAPRPPRFSIPNDERVVIAIGKVRFPGTLRVLSVTGGAVAINKHVAAGTFADLRMETFKGPFFAVIEFLHETKDHFQAFHFVHVEPSARQRLDEALGQLREQGLGESRPTAMGKLLAFARRAMGKP